MEMSKIIEKINYFTKLSRKRELTPEEQAERAEYRKMYLELFKAQVKGHLYRIEIVDDDKVVNKGTKII